MHDKTTEQVFKELKTNKEGLTEEEAHKRLEKYGINEIKQAKKIHPLKIFLEQFHNSVI